MRLPDPLRDVRGLAPWAVEFRYGETIDDQLDREQARTLVRDVIAWAAESIDVAARARSA